MLPRSNTSSRELFVRCRPTPTPVLSTLSGIQPSQSYGFQFDLMIGPEPSPRQTIMPISRKKSCVQCRGAKARCNLDKPCSRCSERDLRCTYAGNPPVSTNEMPTIAQQAELVQSTQDKIVETDIGDPHFTSQDYLHDVEFTENIHQDSAALPLEDLGWITPGWNDSNFPPSLSGGVTPGAFSDLQQMLDLPSQMGSLVSQASASHSRIQSPCIRPSSKDKQNNGHHSIGQKNFSQADEGLVVISGIVYRNILSPRKTESPQSFLMAQMIWGQIRGYPKMIIQGQLPPFIYPPCVFDGILPKNCPHQHYDDNDLLSAFQAITIYLLLQAQDRRPERQNDVISIITILIDIGQQLTQSNNYTYNMYKEEFLKQREWAFHESMRRTMCLLYIIESLLEAMIGRQVPVGCQGFNPVPLPGPRLLWDYNNSEAWAYRLDRLKAEGLSERVMTLRDLRISGNGRAANEEVDEGLIGGMARWCEESDEFGSLLWMVALLK
ncbi:hypothetical protein G7Y89_g9106 [Cudoniella acicularis]|uniref:Zn(2)-C6 fungal-type domain-containing protein n=1 Tax=Cudoniella acicularis TaxID=354080 RepID=A0A8H4RFA0_9HELO|nr:hypothetical protein G7Y89_g9106 [Cudoniella acicularis]